VTTPLQKISRKQRLHWKWPTESTHTVSQNRDPDIIDCNVNGC